MEMLEVSEKNIDARLLSCEDTEPSVSSGLKQLLFKKNRKKACINQFQTLAIKEPNRLLIVFYQRKHVKITGGNDQIRKIVGKSNFTECVLIQKLFFFL